jgi:hypothetical protein
MFAYSEGYRGPGMIISIGYKADGPLVIRLFIGELGQAYKIKVMVCQGCQCGQLTFPDHYLRTILAGRKHSAKAKKERAMSGYQLERSKSHKECYHKK